jgi:hypothetical protein
MRSCVLTSCASSPVSTSSPRPSFNSCSSIAIESAAPFDQSALT